MKEELEGTDPDGDEYSCCASVSYNCVAYLRTTTGGVSLSEHQTRELRDYLTALLGEEQEEETSSASMSPEGERIQELEAQVALDGKVISSLLHALVHARYG